MELEKLRPAILEPDQLGRDDLWQLLDSAAAGVWLARIETGELYWSARLARTLGYDLGMDDVPDLIELTHPADRDRHQQTVDTAMQTGTNYEIEVRMLHRSGGTLWLHAHGRFLRDAAGRPHTLLGFLHDVTDRAEDRLALSRSEARFRSFFDQAPAAVFIKDKDSRHLYGNDVAAEYAGVTLERFLGATAFDLFTPDVAEALVAVDRKVIREGKPVHWTGPIQVPNGDVRQVWDVKFPIEDVRTGERLVGGFGVDVTDLHVTKQQLEVAQRLESIGLLAGGIAHDFNNLLFSISGNAELAMDGATPEGREQLDSILKATEHAAALCRQLLAIGGKARAAPAAIDVVQVLADSVKLFELTLQAHCRLTVKAATGTRLIRADEGQLRQVMVNLLMNARQASERNAEIEIGCFNADLRELDASNDHFLHSWLPQGVADGVCVYVEDHGRGIDPALLGRVFEPYFSGRDKGHGLGLAAVLGIVKGSAGALRVRSEPGAGSRFECYYPAYGEESAAQAEEAEAGTAGHTVRKAMVIDDHRLITKITAKMLERAGVEAESFTSSPAAVEALKERHADFDLVVSDISMPEIGGLEVLKTIRELAPHKPVILASGYGDNGFTFDDDPCTWFLQKPWTPEDLERVLGEITASEGDCS